jgi:hypothetical protein
MGTRDDVRCIVPASLDQTVDVLEKTDCALALLTFTDRTRERAHDPTIRRYRRLAVRDGLPTFRERQDDKWPGLIH